MFHVAQHNLCTKAIEGLRDQIVYLVQDDPSSWAKEIALHLKFIERIERATKFMAPDEGLFFQDSRTVDDDNRWLEEFKLPFEHTCIEYKVTTRGEFVDAFIIIAEEREYSGQAGYELFCAQHYTKKQIWTVAPVTVWAPYGAVYTLDPMTQIKEHPSLRLQLSILSETMLGNALRRNNRSYEKGHRKYLATIEDMAGEIGKAIWYEALSIRQLVGALSCTNVEHIATLPSDRLNAKRARNKRPPFFEYRVLTINTKEHIRHESEVYSSDRQSPKQHLRRGHIRRYASGLRIWVNSMVVGDPSRGYVDKTYKVV